MHATLAFDSNRVPVFQGSCGVVTHYLRKSLRTLGYKVEELYVPLSDKTSALEALRAVDRQSRTTEVVEAGAARSPSRSRAVPAREQEPRDLER